MAALKKRTFGKTGIEITPIGLGSWAIVGGGRPDQVDGIIGAAVFRLDEDKLERIETFLEENP